MEATATHGIWKETISEGYDMIVNTNHNVITISTPNDNPVKYDLKDGITIDDVVRIREEARINFGL
jgi:hypothetical protein